MNKFFTKVASLCVGLAMAAGVGVAVSSVKAEKVKAAEATLAATFNCGADGAASHDDGSTATAYEETSGSYTLSISNVDKFYTGARDAKGNGCLKFGTSKVVGSCAFTAPNDVILVKIYVGGYKATAAKISVNSESTQTISTLSNNGEYTAVEVNTSSSKSVSFTTVSGGVRAMVNTIEFYVDGGSSEKEDTSVTINTPKPLALDLEDSPVTLSVSTSPANLDLTYASGNTAVATVDQSGVVTPVGTGSTTITVSFAGDDDYNASSDTITVNVTRSEPSRISGMTIAEIVAATSSTTPIQLYELEGYVTDWKSGNTDGTQYGNFYIADTPNTSTADSAYVYGANHDNVPSWDGAKYTFSNNKTFLTDDVTSQIQIGTKISCVFMAWMYNGSTFEFSGSIVSIVEEERELSSIEVTQLPTKVEYEVGESFDSTGLEVTAHYSDSFSQVVTPTTISSPDMSTVGQKTITVSYTEDEVTKQISFNIDVTAVATRYTMSFNPGLGSGTMASVEVKEGDSYDLPACTFTAPDGMVFDDWENGGTRYAHIENVDRDYEFTALWKEKPAVTEISDELVNGNTVKNTGTSYSEWTTETMDSGAVYAGQSAGQHTSIQLRSSNSNSGIVSTTSGGKILSVEVVWNSNTSTDRVLDVWASNVAYTNPTEMYNTTVGEKVGSIACANQTKLDIEGDYEYVGVRSNSGAMYLDSITFTWESSETPPTPKVLTSISVSDPKTEYEVGETFVMPTVTAHYDDESEKDVTAAAKPSGFDSSAVVTGQEVEISYTENEVVKTTSFYVNIIEPTPTEAATYKKVQTKLADFSGDYLIVNELSSVAFDSSLDELDKASNNVAVEISDNRIAADEKYEFEIQNGSEGYSIKSSSGYYIGQTSDANGLSSSKDTAYTNSITFVGSDTSDIDIISSGNAHLRYNSNSGQERFRYFKSSTYASQKAISLYIKIQNEAEALALDILSLTSEACAADGEHHKEDFTSAWSTLKTAYAKLGDEKSVLVDGKSDANGTFVAEALARYDLLVVKYGLEEFISGRIPQLAGVYHYGETIDSSSAMIVVVIAAVTSLTSIAVLLVIKRRRALSK